MSGKPHNGTLHSWLRRVPVPTAMRFDGKKMVILSDGSKKWRDAIDVIENLRPEQVELLNSDAAVLRVRQMDWGDVEAAEEKQERRTQALDPADRDVRLAEIVLEATDRGALRHAEAYTFAFSKMYELVQVLSDRMSGLEGAWQETLDKVAKSKGENADETGDGGLAEELVKGLVTRAVQGSAQKGPRKVDAK